MKNSQGGFIVSLIIIVVALLTIGGGAYVYVNKKSSQIPAADVSSQSAATTTATTFGVVASSSNTGRQASTSNIFVFGSNNAIKSGQVIKPGQKVPQAGQILFQATTTYTDSDGVINTVSCGSEGCFENYFASCTPATLQADTGAFGAVQYTIRGKVSSGCSVTFKYTKYSDQTWVNKDMTCPFNNKTSFKEAMNAVFQSVTTKAVVCTGPLYDILSH